MERHGRRRRAPATPKAKPARGGEGALEEAFAALVERTCAALAASKGEEDDAKAWRAAIRRCGDLKAKAGGNRDEDIVHFFAVDGVALSQKHPVVVQKVRATKVARVARACASVRPDDRSRPS